MSINVNKITSTLAKLGDPELQQYAQMHKNDPYIMALAISESNRRKEVRAADQDAQEQPTVVDQMVAEMAPQQMPEDQGIGQLPAGDMNFAGGGIVAFADGGGVERYAPGGVTKAGPDFIRFLQNMGVDYMDFAASPAADRAALTDMFEQTRGAPGAATTSAAPAQAAPTSKSFAAGQAAKPYLQKAGSTVKAGAVPALGAGLSAVQGLSEVDTAEQFLNDPNVSAFDKAKQFTRTAARTALPYAGGIVGSGVTPFVGTAGGALVGTGLASIIDAEGEALKKYRAAKEPSKGPTAVQNRAALNQAEAASRNDSNVYGQPISDAAANAAAATAGTTNVAKPSSVLSGTALSGNKANVGAGTAGGKAPAAASSGLRDDKGIATLYGDLLKSQNYVDPAKGEVDKLAQEELAKATRRKQEYEAFIAKQGDVYKDRSDRLVEREKGIGKQVDQNMGLALLNAGLSIMSTPGSLATAIGKGAQVGTAQFAAGLDRINLARDRLADAKDKLEDLRMNRDEMTFKQRSALEAEIDKAQLDARKMSIDGIRAAAGVTEKRAETILNKTLDFEKTRFEQSEQTKRTLATINASNDGRTKQIWAGLMQKHGNDPVAAAVEYNALEQGNKPIQTAETLVQNRVGEWEKANKMQLNLMGTQAERDAAVRSATQRIRNDIYTQMKLTPTIGTGGSSTAGFRMVN